jgi:hypothetical protein
MQRAHTDPEACRQRQCRTRLPCQLPYQQLAFHVGEEEVQEMVEPTHVDLGAIKEEKLFECAVPALTSTSGLGTTRIDTLTKRKHPLLCTHICHVEQPLGL